MEEDLADATTDLVESALLGNRRSGFRPVERDLAAVAAGSGSLVCDMGAYEYWEAHAWVYLPIVFRDN